MIVKLDGLILKLKIVVSLIFSVLSLWILFPELIRGSLREDLVKQFLGLIVLFWLLLSIVLLIDGIVNLKGYGSKIFETSLSEIEFVKKVWSTQMEDIERSSTVRYSLKCIEHVFDLMLKLMIKRDIRSCLSSSKMVR